MVTYYTNGLENRKKGKQESLALRNSLQTDCRINGDVFDR